jgi:hypothetical protein
MITRRPFCGLQLRVVLTTASACAAVTSCGGPDFTALSQGVVDAGDLGPDVDNTPIILPNPGVGASGTTADAGEREDATIASGTDDASADGKDGDASVDSAKPTLIAPATGTAAPTSVVTVGGWVYWYEGAGVPVIRKIVTP